MAGEFEGRSRALWVEGRHKSKDHEDGAVDSNDDDDDVHLEAGKDMSS